MTVRTTIYLDEALLQRVRRFALRRGLNRFINDAVAEKLGDLERQKVEQAMKEGYLASRADQADVDGEWGVVDIEGWPE